MCKKSFLMIILITMSSLSLIGCDLSQPINSPKTTFSSEAVINAEKCWLGSFDPPLSFGAWAGKNHQCTSLARVLTKIPGYGTDTDGTPYSGIDYVNLRKNAGDPLPLLSSIKSELKPCANLILTGKDYPVGHTVVVFYIDLPHDEVYILEQNYPTNTPLSQRTLMISKIEDSTYVIQNSMNQNSDCKLVMDLQAKCDNLPIIAEPLKSPIPKTVSTIEASTLSPSDIAPLDNSYFKKTTPMYGYFGILPRFETPITSENAPQLQELAYINYRTPVVWHPTENTLITSADGSHIDFLQISSSSITKLRSVNASPFNLRISPNGKYFASTYSPENNFGLYNLSDGSLIKKILGDSQSPSYSATVCAFSPDNEILATAFGDQILSLYHLPAVSLFKSINYDTFINSLTFSSDGKLLIIGGYDGTVKIWNLEDDFQTIPLSILENNSLSFADVSISPNGNYLVASGLMDKDKKFLGFVRVWDVKNLNEIYNIQFDHWVSGVTISPNNDLLAVNADDLYLVNLEDGRTLSQLQPYPVDNSGAGTCQNSIAFSPDGTMLASLSHGCNYISIWGLPK